MQIRQLLVLSLLLQVMGCAKYSPANAPPSGMRASSSQDRAVIRSGNLELRGRDLSVIKADVVRIIDGVHGWVESWSLTDTRWLHMTLRVPETTLDDIMNKVSSMGKVISRSVSSEDVTEELIDLEARLKNLTALRDRLRGYLDRASDLKEILEVERELTRVQTEIEALEGKLKVLKARVTMSELRLTVKKGRV